MNETNQYISRDEQRKRSLAEVLISAFRCCNLGNSADLIAKKPDITPAEVVESYRQNLINSAPEKDRVFVGAQYDLSRAFMKMLLEAGDIEEVVKFRMVTTWYELYRDDPAKVFCLLHG